MNTLQQTKSMLAKLLASENITVEFRKAQTASFDIKNRVMVLPLWENTSAELYDLLGGHEVGHALYTPAQGWHDAVLGGVDANFKTFLNVVEDARIERKIKDKFPGIRKSFIKGYRELIERDFFGVNNTDINSLMLIDRINLHFKSGTASSDILFSGEEMVFIDRIKVADTWGDVYTIAKDLFEYCKRELKEMQEQKKQMAANRMSDMDFDYEDDEGEFGEAGEDEGEEGDSFSKNGLDEDSTDEEDGSEDSSEHGSTDAEDGEGLDDNPISQEKNMNETYLKENDPISITDRNFQEKVKTLGQSKNVMNGVLPSMARVNVSSIVVPWKEIYGQVINRDVEAFTTSAFIEFESKNKSAVSYLVKEFEMRKKAAELRRVSISDTGVIDTNLLHSYKFSDDIFRKSASIAQGKNHGMVSLVDWSGSMTENLSGTIEQMLVLTLFCRKINIPFEVYAFSTSWFDGDDKIIATAPAEPTIKIRNEIDMDRKFHLLNLLSSKMSNQAYRTTANDLLNLANAHRAAYAKKYIYGAHQTLKDMTRKAMELGGTPLNASIIALSKIINDFRINNRLEIVNTVILTDGEDRDHMYCRGDLGQATHSVGPDREDRTSYVFDPDTKKSFKIGVAGITPTLLEILKARTGCNLVGFYIIKNSRRPFEEAVTRLKPGTLSTQIDSMLSEFRKSGVYSIESYGYDEYYLIPGGADLEVNEDSLDDMLGKDAKISSRKLKGAFLRLNQNRLNSRVLLKKFIEQTA